MTERKWLAECHAWLDDPESVQYKTSEGRWYQPANGECTPVHHPHLTWRIKPKTITINGEEFEAPVLPHQANQYHINFTTENEDHCRCFWFSTPEARDAVYKKLVEVLS